MHIGIKDIWFRRAHGAAPINRHKASRRRLPAPAFSPQSGSIFFGVFAALAMVGVLGASTMMIMKGPVRTMHRVTQRTIAENNMIASAKLAVMGAGAQGDCDGDTAIEPMAFLTSGTGPKPSGGGYLPADLGAALEDPWGNAYGYCSWDHGSAIKKTNPAPTCPAPSSRLKGSADSKGPVVAIVSSGPDRVFQTSCGDAPTFVHKVSGSDDIIMQYTYAEANAMAGGLWTLKSGDADTAEIAKDLEVKDADDNVVFGVDSTTDADKPSIKVDYIKALGQPQVEMISPLRISGKGTSGTQLNIQDRQYARTATGAYANVRFADKNDNQIGFVGDGSAGATNMMLASNAAPLSLLTNEAYPITFHTYNSAGTGIAQSEKMRITPDGNVGIGTETPKARLHIVGQPGTSRPLWLDYPFEGPVIVMRSEPASSFYPNVKDRWEIYPTGINSTSTESALSFGTRDNSTKTAAILMTIMSNGNVGIGAARPSSKLYVKGDVVATESVTTPRVSGLSAPSAASDAANKSYVDAHIAAGAGFSETDPQVSTVTNGKWCRGNGSAVVCDRAAPLASFSEADPQVSTVTNGKWCRGNGSAVVCDQAAPSSGSVPGTLCGLARVRNGTSVQSVTECNGHTLGSGPGSVSCPSGYVGTRMYLNVPLPGGSYYDFATCVKT